MGDNIRLKGPLGLKQDIYDDKRAKEFKKLFQLTPKEFITEYEKKLLAEKKQEKNGGYMKVKKLLPGGLLTPGMRVLMKTAQGMKMKKTPDIAKEQFKMIDTARGIVQKSGVKVEGRKIDTDFLSEKDEVFKNIATGLAKQKKAKVFQTLSERAIESPGVSKKMKESLKETIPKLKEYNDNLVKKILAYVEKDVQKPTMQKSGGFIDMTKDKKYWKGIL
jgi:hypothetical protein